MAEGKRLSVRPGTEFNLEALLDAGNITNDFEYQRAVVALTKLHVQARQKKIKSDSLASLHQLILNYERKHWSVGTEISQEKIAESDHAELLAEEERIFLERRKKLIKSRLKDLEMTQEDLAKVLGHKSSTHMSELINGLKPFMLNDLVIISLLCKISLKQLIPVFLSPERKESVRTALISLNRPSLSKALHAF